MKFLLDFMLFFFFLSKTNVTFLYYCLFVFSSNMSTPISLSGYDSGIGNMCGYVGDDEDYDDEVSGNDLTKFLIDFMVFFCQKHILPFYFVRSSFCQKNKISELEDLE